MGGRSTKMAAADDDIEVEKRSRAAAEAVRRMARHIPFLPTTKPAQPDPKEEPTFTEKDLVDALMGWVDATALLADLVPHLVVPQLLIPVIAEAFPPTSLIAPDDADIVSVLTHVHSVDLLPQKHRQYRAALIDCLLVHGAPMVTKLRYGDCERDEVPFDTIGQLTSLTDLTFSFPGAMNAVAFQPIAALPSLTALDLTGCRDFFVVDEAVGVAVSEMVQLQRLRVELGMSGRVIKLFATLPELWEITLRGGSLWVGGLAAFAATPQLTHLHLQDCKGLAGSGVAEVSRSETITTFTADGCVNLRPTAAAALAQLPALTHLSLARCANVDDRAVAALATAPRLTYLDITRTAFRANPIFAGTGSFPRLKHLCMRDLRDVNPDAGALIQTYAALETLELQGTLISKESLELIGQLPYLRNLLLK